MGLQHVILYEVTIWSWSGSGPGLSLQRDEFAIRPLVAGIDGGGSSGTPPR